MAGQVKVILLGPECLSYCRNAALVANKLKNPPPPPPVDQISDGLRLDSMRAIRAALADRAEGLNNESKRGGADGAPQLSLIGLGLRPSGPSISRRMPRAPLTRPSWYRSMA